MKCFRIIRRDIVGWCEDHSMVVIASDELHAERRARWSSSDFKDAILKVIEVDMDVEQTVLTANRGA